ncbi:Shikimate O-hydroxycinnamoyltransferase [Vitis vinifera]|uniref:Shikimate O-hydroxycinnamoyltransferase n=1 Tax=Vitis vinifera TaxID=29760 RepID=A0A438DSH2_VITVI|nr:Shikimate O-hydroxycinnamoyltransferase [Vitis vinifera]
MVADGSGCIHFINSWSGITRGIPIAISPFFDRTILRARDPPAPRFSHVEYLPPPPLHGPSTPKPTSTLILHLTPEHLNALKAKSARGLSHDQPTKLYIPTDGRLRLRPTLPPGYFGNALFTSTLTANSGDLQSEAFSDTVQRIRNAIAGMEDEYLRSAVDYLEMQPNLTALVRGAHTFRSPNLVVGSWTRLPIHDANFGWEGPCIWGWGVGCSREMYAYNGAQPRTTICL